MSARFWKLRHGEDNNVDLEDENFDTDHDWIGTLRAMSGSAVPLAPTHRFEPEPDFVKAIVSWYERSSPTARCNSRSGTRRRDSADDQRRYAHTRTARRLPPGAG